VSFLPILDLPKIRFVLIIPHALDDIPKVVKALEDILHFLGIRNHLFGVLILAKEEHWPIIVDARL